MASLPSPADPARHPARRRATWLALAFLALAALLAPSPAAASIGEVLRGHGDVAFEPAGRDAEFPLVIVPREFAQDGAGFLWAGGPQGLFRWDGYGVVQYLAGSRRPDGLADHEVTALHADAAGTLWVGTTAGGLARYDPAAEHFVAVPLPGGSARALAVGDIADDGAGGLLVATADGLFHRDAAGRTARLTATHLCAVLRDRDGRVWIGGPGGLATVAPGASGDAWQATPVALVAPGEPAPLVSRLVQDATGALWIGTHDGAFVLAPGASRPVAVALAADALSAHEVMAMAEIRPGEAWIGTYGQGILAARADGTARRITADAHAPKGLDSNVIFALFRDRCGVGWVSTPFGISHADMPRHDAVVPLFNHPGSAGRLTVAQPTALLARRRGDLWIGSEEDGIEILDDAGNPAGHVPVQPVVSLAEAPDGRVFAGGRGGAYVIDADGQKAVRLPIPGRPATATVWALATVGDTLWLGGDTDGVWMLRAPPGGPVTVLRHIVAPGGATSGRVAAILPLPDGEVSVATGDGLWLVAPATGELRVVRALPGRADGLPSDHLSSLGLDGRGRLWVGTEDAGLAVLQSTTGVTPHVTRIGIDDGLGNPDVDAILPGARGRMWVATDSGLATVDMASLAVHRLSVADGVAVTGYWEGSATATADGDLLFGGTGGLTVARPDLLVGGRAAAPVAVTRLVAGGRLVSPSPDGTVTLPPAARSLSVEFASLDFADPRRNRYRYRLRGFDPGWIETDAGHRVAAYTNLRPGSYVLELSGSDHTGVWGAAPVRIRVRVPAAWYETVAFEVVVGAAFLALFAVLLQVRTRLLRLHQRRLERQVAERTAALRDSEARLEHLAHADPLTALPNRRALNNRMAQLCLRGDRADFALAILDIDGFKPVNDSLGHDVGDKLLVVIADRLRRCVGSADLVARWGGDEFAILITGDARHDHVERLCDAMIRAASEPVTIDGRPVRVGASVGVALCPLHGADPDAIYKCADLALYAAKHAGRGTWRWFARALAETV